MSVEVKDKKIIIDDDVERKETEEEFFERFLREFNRLPPSIQEGLIKEEIKRIQNDSAKKEIEELIRATTNKAEKQKLKLKKKLLEKNIAKQKEEKKKE
jgi:hypothetical protein